MFTEVYLGKEAFVTNAYGEKSKSISYSASSLFCLEKSVRSSEFYQAMQSGLKAEKVISLNKYEYLDYMLSAVKRYAKVVDSYTQEVIEYTIVREYQKDDDSIELTLQRGVENVNA